MAFCQTQVGTLNYMPPEAIKDTSSHAGKARSKVHQISRVRLQSNNPESNTDAYNVFFPPCRLVPKVTCGPLGVSCTA